jgi:hypothetical protein
VDKWQVEAEKLLRSEGVKGRGRELGTGGRNGPENVYTYE